MRVSSSSRGIDTAWGCGVSKLDHALDQRFLATREGPDRCLSRLVQNLISRRSLRIHSASCGTLLRTRGSAA
jgi:hypothetical protein